MMAGRYTSSTRKKVTKEQRGYIKSQIPVRNMLQDAQKLGVHKIEMFQPAPEVKAEFGGFQRGQNG